MTHPFATGQRCPITGAVLIYQSVSDRLARVRTFDRAQCEAALALPELQKTVAAAVRRRLKFLAKENAQ